MPLAGTTVWECQTGGSDTANGGAFDPGQTAGMWTDGTATSPATASPVFSSASYNFVAGDVGAWVYISSGTSSGGVVNAGWYKITSVAANAATLNATIGQGVLKSSFIPSTLTGVVTGTTLTSATWSIDYSQQSAVQVSYTDLASAGTGLTVSSVAKPFGRHQVGNALIITAAGTNFNLGTYVIASVAAVTFVATVVGPTNITTGAGVNGVGAVGGAILSPATAASLKVANNQVWIKSGTYNITTASTNVANGCINEILGNSTVGNHLYEGYGSIRGDLGTAPVLLAGNAISTFTLLNIATAGSAQLIRNITLDAASLTSGRGLVTTRSYTFYKITVKNCTNDGINNTSTSLFVGCSATGCSSVGFGFNCTLGNFYGCEAYSNTVGGFNFNGAIIANNCLSYANSGGSSDGFAPGSINILSNCVAYNNGRDGFRRTSGTGGVILINCIAEQNAGIGFNSSTSAIQTGMLINCAARNNTSSDVDNAVWPFRTGFVTGSGSFFTNAAAGDFSLNNTAGAGASVRAAGYPGVYPAGTTTGFLDIGAAQHADPASSGGIRLAGRGGLASGV